MEHKNCRHLLDSLSEYIDGTLEAGVCSEIDQHLQGCENCRIVVDSLRKTIYLYQVSSQSTAVPQDVRERLYRKLDLKEILGE